MSEDQSKKRFRFTVGYLRRMSLKTKVDVMLELIGFLGFTFQGGEIPKQLQPYFTEVPETVPDTGKSIEEVVDPK